MTNRKNFIRGLAAVGASALAADCLAEAAKAVAGGPSSGIRVRFLGSGASGWKREWGEKNPYMRRQSSLLVENRALIDFTPCSFDFLPKGCRPEVLFQTHSHGDHYSPQAAVKVGVRRMYVHETWAATARRQVAEAAQKLSLPAPEVIALRFGEPVEACGLRFMAVPANHSTSRMTDGVLERTALYLVEKGESRLFYATDTGGIPGDAARMIGIDPHVTKENLPKYYAGNPMVSEPKAITAFIMEATDGDIDDDFRLFVHSSVQAVSRTVNMLKKFGRFTPPEGQSAYLTHLAIKYRGWVSEKIDAELPEGLKSAYDGLELVLG